MQLQHEAVERCNAAAAVAAAAAEGAAGGGAGLVADGADRVPLQQQQQQGQHAGEQEPQMHAPPEMATEQAVTAPLLQHQEVLRVTATNLDMSRPLRSADLLSVYRASLVPQPGQVGGS